MLLTMCITVVVFHGLFSEQVMEDLKTHVHILKSTEAVLEYVEKDFDPQIDNLRITVIDSDGKVIYDSNADIGTMENHGNRPEVHEALEKGSGEAKRKSSTLDKTTYYYAEKMSDGRVIKSCKGSFKYLAVLLKHFANTYGRNVTYCNCLSCGIKAFGKEIGVNLLSKWLNI